MKIAVIGAGAIGGLVAGYLKLKNEDVSLVGRGECVKNIKETGVEISGVRGDFHIRVDIADSLSSRPDLVVLATKTQDVQEALKSNLELIRGALILTTQNGIQADRLALRYVPRENIISSIVMFGATYLEPGKIVHNFEGSWIIGRMFQENDDAVIRVGKVLDKAFPVAVVKEIEGMKYLKIFINANNCIPAILGMSMQEAFGDLEISRISIAIWKEGLDIVSRSGINLVSLPDFPLERLIKLTSLPIGEATRIFSGIMQGLSKEPLYGSILQSIKRGRTSEIDYINGEFVRLARENSLCAPLNGKLVEMVHQVESANKFFSKTELLDNTKEWIH